MSTAKKTPGRAAGGLARAAALSEERKREISKKGHLAKQQAALALRATHGSDEKPLTIGDVEIPCYVLEDETRVLSQRGLLAGLGLPRGSTPSGEDQLTVLANALLAQKLITPDLALILKKPIVFRPKHGGRPAHGYPATVLADLCEAILAARASGQLVGERQQMIAKQCEILVRGFARVGIIALVDEATGYQADRARDALAKILEAFVAQEIQPYVQTFPIEYYKELFRLRGLPFSTDSVKRPQYFGVLTNDIVYKRLAPGVLEELQRVTPRNEDGRPKAKYFQSLTGNLGYPKLQQHLGKVIATMSFSENYDEFKVKLDKIAPRMDKPTGPEQEDTGKGI
ncbi:P63C domain-containing protein [Variovorax paradoxus]|uniref:Bacteriophage Mx8 p63 C-terminal domain-containing protein n=1 Tax=Variovorax paradoxus (strain EPS) TaxID=595537 RepID=E6V9V5_VARPE|nr:P63C domain-containing protein [Variovorax paradoxus]ADU36243.1 Domain of unknown function P63C [Variovorax paradoxus EPS]